MAMRVKIRPPKIRPSKIMPRKPEIMVAIPTYNEAESIAEITKTVDEGLRKYFPNKKALIVNIDSNSPDNTRKIFLSTKTRTPKHCIKTPKGKGKSLRELFKYFLKTESAEVLMLLDANVETASPRWVRNLITPILKGFDHVFPIYDRHEYDASITNQLAYPVMRGVLGIDIRQPIAGETAMSRKAVDRLNSRTWPQSANKHGIDILASLSSSFAELRIAQSYLGERYHDTTEEKISDLFEDIASTLFEKLDKHTHVWKDKIRVRRPPLFFKGSRRSKFQPAEIAYKSYHESAIEEFKKHKNDIKKIVSAEMYKKLNAMFKPKSTLKITAKDWTEIVFDFVKASKLSAPKRAKALRPLYFGRFITFYRSYLDKSHKVSERAIIEQADLFYKNRKRLID